MSDIVEDSKIMIHTEILFLENANLERWQTGLNKIKYNVTTFLRERHILFLGKKQ